MKGFLFSPPVTRHPIWTPRLGQTTVTTTTTSGGGGAPAIGTEVFERQGAGADMITLVAVGGAVLLVTEVLGVTHVTQWFGKTLGLTGSKKKK